MESQKQESIRPSLVTKPIQLLAAWLVGLISIEGIFVGGAAAMSATTWVSAALVIAAIVNVPLFIVSIFLLQTKFRPEMQEDDYYSKYIDKKFGNTRREVAPEAVQSLAEQLGEFSQHTSENLRLLRDDFARIALANVAEIETGNGVAHLAEPILPDNVFSHPFETPFFGKTIAVNSKLPFFRELTQQYSANKIPVHETFGGGPANTPSKFCIAIGDGFSLNEITAILKATIAVRDGIVTFADDDDKVDQYENMILVGSYGTEKGIKISTILGRIQSGAIDENKIYDRIGKK